MDKYQALRENIERTCRAMIGKTPDEATKVCEDAGLYWRAISIDGRGCMITADCRMDRIDATIKNGVITKANQFK